MSGKLIRRLIRSWSSTAIFGLKKIASSQAASKGVRILTYHRLNNNRADSLSVYPTDFDAQMGYLQHNGYNVISFDDFYRHVQKQIELPDHSVIIATHDGYRDNYAYGFPVLRQHGFPATIFLTTGSIGGTLFGEQMLSWQHVCEMSNWGISFGAHSVTHPFLTKLPLAKAKAEIEESKLVIENILGKEVNYFCYPFGDFNEPIKNIVQECGYLGACSILPGANTLRTDPFALMTTEIIAKGTLFDFEKTLAGAYDLWSWGIQLVLKNHFPRLFYSPGAREMIQRRAKGDQ